MTDHDHREFVPGCFRCDLSRDEVGEPCPSCDRGLWHPGHRCYTYAEWAERVSGE